MDSFGPYGLIPPPVTFVVFLVALASTVGFGTFFAIHGRKLNSPETPCGIVSFELAGSEARARKIICVWKRKGVLQDASIDLYVDFAFIIAYAITFSIACFWTGDLLSENGWSDAVVSIGLVLGWGSFLAGAFDVVENVALLKLLRGPVNSGWPRVARWSAIPKFVLIAAAFAYSSFGAAYKFYGWL